MVRWPWLRRAAETAIPLALLAGTAAMAAGPTQAGAPPEAPPAAALEQEEGRVRLELLAEAEVSGPAIHLDEVARLVEGDGQLWARLGTIAVGAAPLPGEQRILALASVRAALHRAGVEPRSVQWVRDPALAVVRGRAARLDPDVVRDAIVRYLAGWTQADARLAGESGRPRPLTVGSLEWDGRLLVGVGPVTAEVVAAPPILRPGPAVFSVEIQSPATPARRVWVRAVLEPAGLAGPGALLTPAAAVTRAAMVDLAGGPGDPSASEGAEPAPPARPPGKEHVEAGTAVLLMATRGPLTVSVPAVVRSGGQVGTVVEVVNALSGQMVAAVLVSAERAVAVGSVQASRGGAPVAVSGSGREAAPARAD